MQAQPEISSREDAESPLHEGSAIHLGGVVVFVVCFVVITAIILVGVFGTYRLYEYIVRMQMEPVNGLTISQNVPPEPRMQPSVEHNQVPAVDLQDMRDRDMNEFRRLHWVDATGKVRIPDNIARQVQQLSKPANTTRTSP